MAWHPVADFDDCPEGASEHVVEKRIVAIMRRGDLVSALDGVCPHQGGPLGQGTLDSTTSADDSKCYVTCPWHGWQFDVETGQHRTSPMRHAAWPTKIVDGKVLVDLPDQGP